MEVTPALQIVAFLLFAAIAVAGALGMATTMSMFRSGVFLMASFMGVGGLFILLMADLLGMLQIMMYIGGMLVMILFMVLFSPDPGGQMMVGMMKQGMMKMSSIEMLFSRGLAQPQDASEHDSASPMHVHDGTNGNAADKRQASGNREIEDHGGAEARDRQQKSSTGEHEENDSGKQQNGESKSIQHDQMQHGGMDMSDMSMFTPIKKQAAVLALVTGALLVTLILLRPSWPVVSQTPDQNSPGQVGALLMGKYMIAFEGSGLLILLGIFASVMISRPSGHPDPSDREHLHAAVEQTPAPVEPDPIEAIQPSPAREEERV